MRKVIRGYARDKHSNLILVGTISVPQSKDKRSPVLVRIKDFWSDKERRSSRKKPFVSALGRPKDFNSCLTFWLREIPLSLRMQP
jgi:hypothetical protein